MSPEANEWDRLIAALLEVQLRYVAMSEVTAQYLARLRRNNGQKH